MVEIKVKHTVSAEKFPDFSVLYSLYKKIVDKNGFYGTIYVVCFIPICEVTDLEQKSHQTDASLNALVLQAQQGEDAAFSRLAAEMIMQEGLLALLSAVHTYSVGGEASFKTYATVCIRNRMISVLRRAVGGKSVRTQDTVPLESKLSASDLTVEEHQDLREECENLLRRVDTKLSQNERTVLYLFLSGLSYREIAERLGKTPKSVDNALQRVRHKLKGE